MIALLAAALLAVAPAPRHAVDDPIAVMPFKNLNADTTLDWLKAGVAETMISDLKKAGKTRVVERDQVDRAVTEIALQETAGSEESAAAKVGKLVGAKTIVLGSFQKAGSQLRINARFVSVETGEVLDTAKTTGAASDPFALQDRIVAQLMGSPSGTAPVKRKPATARTVEAYRLYALSLTVSSDSEKATYLKQSLAIDPDFVYSLEDLAALKKRLEGLFSIHSKALDANDAALQGKAFDAALSPEERATSAGKLLDSLLNARRFHALAEVSTRVYEARIPAAIAGKPDITQYASYCRVIAYQKLNAEDRALQAGEAYLKEFPGGFGYDNIETLIVRRLIDAKETRARRWQEYQDDIVDRRKAAGDEPRTPYHQVLWDYAPCMCAWQNGQTTDTMLSTCTEFLRQDGDTTEKDGRDYVFAARRNVVVALVNLGRFDEARAKLAEWPELRADDDGHNSFEMLDRTVWPSD